MTRAVLTMLRLKEQCTTSQQPTLLNKIAHRSRACTRNLWISDKHVLWLCSCASSRLHLSSLEVVRLSDNHNNEKESCYCCCSMSLKHNFFFIIYFNTFPLHRTVTVSRFSFSLDLYTVGRTPWTSDRPVARTAQTQNKRARAHTHTHTHQTSMTWMGLEPTITAS
jgi:hypothetical protein